MPGQTAAEATATTGCGGSISSVMLVAHHGFEVYQFRSRHDARVLGITNVGVTRVDAALSALVADRATGGEEHLGPGRDEVCLAVLDQCASVPELLKVALDVEDGQALDAPAFHDGQDGLRSGGIRAAQLGHRIQEAGMKLRSPAQPIGFIVRASRGAVAGNRPRRSTSLGGLQMGGIKVICSVVIQRVMGRWGRVILRMSCLEASDLSERECRWSRRGIEGPLSVPRATDTGTPPGYPGWVRQQMVLVAG